MPKKILELPNESVLSEKILNGLAQQNQPKTAKELRRLLTGPFKLPEDRLIELLTSLVTKGKIFEWPAKGKGKPRYWKEQPSQFISKKIVEGLTEKPLTSLELKKVLGKQLFGIPKPKKDIDHGIQSLLLQGTILQHPKVGGIKAKLGLRPPDPKPYLQKVQKELDQVFKMLAPSQVSREAINKALFNLLGISTISEVPLEEPRILDLEDQIISEMVKIEPRASTGALVSLQRLRKSLGLEKELFDRTIINMAKKSRIILHEHSFPMGVSEEERNYLVDDKKGHWYVGAVLKDK